MPYLVENEDLTLDSNLIERIDAWAKKRPLVLSRAQAIIQLIEKGLGNEQEDPSLIKLTPGEEIIISMMTSRWRGEFPRAYEAFNEGQFYDLPQGPMGVASRNDCFLVDNVLAMWADMKTVFQRLTDEQKLEVSEATGWDAVEFPGFASFYNLQEDVYFRIMKYLLKNNPFQIYETEELAGVLNLDPQDHNFDNDCMQKYAATYDQMPAYQAMLLKYDKLALSEIFQGEREPDPHWLIDLIEIYQQNVEA